jgi:hypothetical protein
VNLLLQPVLPVSLTDNWNLITRPVIPVFNSTPYVNKSGNLHRVTGFGDTVLVELLSPSPKLAGPWLFGGWTNFHLPDRQQFAPRPKQMADGSSWNSRLSRRKVDRGTVSSTMVVGGRPGLEHNKPDESSILLRVFSGRGLVGRQVAQHAGAETTYGVCPEQVIGSSGRLRFEIRNGKPVLIKLPEIDFINDNVGKPAAIQKHIGRRPIASFGNSDGDLEMLQWTSAGKGPRFALLIHHTDATREWAYDYSPMWKLDKALDEANAKGWTVVDMTRDWRRVFAFE